MEKQHRPSKRKISWLKNLKDWHGLDSTSLLRAAASKVRIARMTTNLRPEDTRRHMKKNNETQKNKKVCSDSEKTMLAF